MKKLIISPGYYPPHIGGHETHVEELAKRLSKKGFLVTIFAPNIPKTKEYEKINENFKVIRYPAFEIIANYPVPKFWSKKYRGYLKAFKKEGFDFVMSRTRFFFSSFLACRFAKKNRIKFVHVEHGSEYVRLKNPITTAIAWLYDQTIGRYVIKSADICIAISQASLKFLRRFQKNGKIPVITRGVEFEYIDSIAPDEKLREKYRGNTIIGFVGRIIHWKGLKNALEGFNMLDTKNKEKCVFLVIGDGPDYNALKDSYQSKSIVFLGRKARDESIAAMKTFDIFVHSTISGGGLSNSLLEAMTVGCAIIATKAEGADEVLDDKSAVMLEKSGPMLFKKGFEKIIKDNELSRRIRINAQNYVKNNFSWEDKAKEYVKVLK